MPDESPRATRAAPAPNPRALARRISPRLADRLVELVRGPSWRRVAILRRAAAAALVIGALVLALRPGGHTQTVPVLVAAHDLGPGATLRASDVEVRRRPSGDVPDGALRRAADAEGQVLAGAARAGEPLTDLRLVGPELTRRATGSADAARVPVRLADADVAALLQPGSTVDVVTTGEHGEEPVVLATGAIVLAVLPAEGDAARRGRLILVALPRSAATRVAGTSLAQPVTVTLR